MSVTNGAWVLPESENSRTMFEQLATAARSDKGSAAVFFSARMDKAESAALIRRFCDDREREYGELHLRMQAFLAEIKKETGLLKFTFAELEEIEDDFAKLSAWLKKISERDFFPGGRLKEEQDKLLLCERAMQKFARKVYEKEGVGSLAKDAKPQNAMRGMQLKQSARVKRVNHSK